jgi:hypothetical protein
MFRIAINKLFKYSLLEWSPPTVAVLSGGRGHRQITQNRPDKKSFAVKNWWWWKWPWVTIRCCDTNLVEYRKFVSCWIQKWRAEIKKWQNPSPNIMFFVFYCCALKYHAAGNLLIGGRESFENGPGFWRMWPWMLVRTWQHCTAEASVWFPAETCQSRDL